MSSDPACKLKNGEVVAKKWKVIDLLGKGSFGAVYKVCEVKWVCWCRTAKVNELQYALKIESNKAEKDMQLLKVDKMVMEAINSPHVPQLRAGGKNDRFSYLVMTLLGPSLKNLWKNFNKKFTPGTALRVLLKCFKAIEVIHDAQFVHRDIKPDNFAIGPTKETEHNMYIFDFGLARPLTTKVQPTGWMRPKRPKDKVGFRGTAPYASINAHEDKEFGRHDDLISTLYMTAELMSGKLPWKDLEDGGDNEKVVECKKEMRLTLYKHYDDGDLLLQLQEHLYELEYKDEPNYAEYYSQIKKRIAEKGYNESPLDWQTA